VVTPHYAVKANSNPMIIRMMVVMGSRFYCARNMEIESVLSLRKQKMKTSFMLILVGL